MSSHSAAGSAGDLDGILFDLDGVFYVGDQVLPGALETLDVLEERLLSYCFITNTTTRSAAELQAKLDNLGIPCRREQLISAPVATAAYLRQQGLERCYFAVNSSVMADFADFTVDESKPQAVVVGDIGTCWSYGLLDQLFQYLLSGATLVAMHRNRYWQKAGGLHMDIGGFVAALEYAANLEAVVTGKPSQAFFTAALDYLGVDRARALLVGDDIDADIGGAQGAGIRAALVQTGKYRGELVERSSITPDWVIPSIADLPDILKTASSGKVQGARNELPP